MKDTKSILLLLVSLLLIGTWVFHIYDKSKYASVTTVLPKSDTVAINKFFNDSLNALYQTTVVQIEDVKFGKDSLTYELQSKIKEIDTLRYEIARILNVTNLTKEDLKNALIKIQLLQQKISGVYQQTNTTITNQNQSNSVVQTNNKKTQATVLNEEVVLQANEIKMQAIKKPENTTDNSEDATDQFRVSFVVKPNRSTAGSGNVYLILKDPLGNIIQDDQWIAGVFNSKNDGLMKYSRKLNFDYSNGEVQKINTSIPVNKLGGGGYQVQIYYNGQRIGKADLVLN